MTLPSSSTPPEAALGILRVTIGTGGANTQPELLEILDQMKQILSEDDVSVWSEVFRSLFRKHAQARQFNVIRAALISLPTVKDVRQWGRTWMQAMFEVGPHPISLPLCAAGHRSSLREAWVSAYNRAFPKLGHPRIKRLEVKEPPVGFGYVDERERWWILELVDKEPEYLLSTHPIVVQERVPGRITRLGLGWLVRELVLLDMPELRNLGPQLVVMTNLVLNLTHRFQGLTPDCLIGGGAWMTTPDLAWDSARITSVPGDTKNVGVGWRESEGFWVSDSNGRISEVEDISTPLDFGESWFAMFNGLFEEE